MDDYDYEEESGSESAITGIINSLIPVGESLASQAISQSNLQPVNTNIPVGYVAAPSGNMNIIFWLFIAAVAFILYKVL